MSLEYKKLLSFTSFLLVAGLLWFVFKYKEVYTQRILVNLEWTNIPDDIKIKEDKIYYIDAELTGVGFNLLKSKYFAPSVKLDFTKYVMIDSLYIFNPQSALVTLKEQLGSKFKVDYVVREPIQIELVKFISKTVPLRRRFAINYNSNLQPTEKPYFQPDSVLVTGNDLVLKDIQQLEVEINDLVVSDTLFMKDIDLSELFDNVKISPSQVEYVVHSSVMTEGSFTIPINIINNNNNNTVKVIPSEVNIVFTCKLSDYEDIGVSDFVINLDYDILTKEYNLVTLNIDVLNDKVFSVRHTPQQAQVLLIQ